MRIIITTLSIFISILTFGQEIKSVLFFGNSYTDANDLPRTTQLLANSLGDSLYAMASTRGGQRLSGHASDPNSYMSMQMTPWDFVVFQEQSQLPSFPASQVITDVFPYAKQLCDSVHLLPNCTKPMFFMTWGRENGDQQNCQFYPPLCTYEGMQLELRKNYLQMGLDNDAYVSPVGMVWREVRRRIPQMKLYDPDESHPSQIGTYVAACTFYAAIFGKSPVGATYNGTLWPAEADSIQQIVQEIVFDSLHTWNMETSTFNADFNFHVNNDMVTFNYLGPINADVYWEFGNGQSDTGGVVTHHYGVADTFKVRMRVNERCERSIISKTVITQIQGDSIVPDFSFSANYDTVMFLYTGSPADSVFWSFGDGGKGNNMNETYIYGVADTFSVMLKAYSGTAIDSVTKKVITTLKDTATASVSVFPIRQVKVYPNPAFNNLNIETESLIKSICLIDLNGKIVRKIENILEYNYVLLNNGEFDGRYVLLIETNDTIINQNVNFRTN
ncbi:MAG: DUF4886 domain-containing protein [Salibacteraceae bacterium]